MDVTRPKQTETEGLKLPVVYVSSPYFAGTGTTAREFFWDTRQVTTAREGHFLLWPSPIVLDANGVDLNASPSFNFLAVQSRLSGKITGPDAFGAKTSGMIEGAFFGQSAGDINGQNKWIASDIATVLPIIFKREPLNLFKKCNDHPNFIRRLRI